MEHISQSLLALSLDKLAPDPGLWDTLRAGPLVLAEKTATQLWNLMLFKARLLEIQRLTVTERLRAPCQPVRGQSLMRSNTNLSGGLGVGLVPPTQAIGHSSLWPTHRH